MEKEMRILAIAFFITWFAYDTGLTNNFWKGGSFETTVMAKILKNYQLL